MNFNKHSNLVGRHAFLSASNYHWVNYDEQKLDQSFMKWRAIQRGTQYHEFAKKAIELEIKMPKTKNTLNMYINDAIDFHLTPEQPLYYSENAFGTPDTIGFDEYNGVLRTHDLKTGRTRASMTQLDVYDALFCLEYRISPYDIPYIENRIYQYSSVIAAEPSRDHIREIMDKIIIFDKRIEQLKCNPNFQEEGG